MCQESLISASLSLHPAFHLKPAALLSSRPFFETIYRLRSGEEIVLFGKPERVGTEDTQDVADFLQPEGGVLSVDDTVIGKPCSAPDATELIGFFRSGLHHKTVKGINLIALVYTDPTGLSMAVNFRGYSHSEGRLKMITSRR